MCCVVLELSEGKGARWLVVALPMSNIDTDTKRMGESLRSPATVVARQAVPVRPSAVEVDGIRFAWNEHGSDVLDMARFAVATGERVFVEGPSGSGKSTLLGLIGGVLRPREGTVRVLGTSVSAMPARLRDRFRADHIGFIFQMFNLVPYLSVIDNVTLPCRFSRRRRERAEMRSATPDAEAHRLLGLLGLDRVELLGRVVTDLSIGQQQRVAAARALIGETRADHRRRADLRPRRGHAGAFSRSSLRAVWRGGRVAALREPRHAAGRPFRSPCIAGRPSARRPGSDRLIPTVRCSA